MSVWLPGETDPSIIHDTVTESCTPILTMKKRPRWIPILPDLEQNSIIFIPAKYSFGFSSPCVTACRWWQTFLVVLVIYSAWASPFELAFKKVATGSLMPVDLTVDAFFAADIVLTFFVAYLDKSTYLLVDDHKKIAIRYATTLLKYSNLVNQVWLWHPNHW